MPTERIDDLCQHQRDDLQKASDEFEAAEQELKNLLALKDLKEGEESTIIDATATKAARKRLAAARADLDKKHAALQECLAIHGRH